MKEISGKRIMKGMQITGPDSALELELHRAPDAVHIIFEFHKDRHAAQTTNTDDAENRLPLTAAETLMAADADNGKLPVMKTMMS
jgi:hypothetical protein